ncbi:hypothetical protein EXIGLDRAFT_775665 [Exidia glandulosa HHB12029]|uniref:F-box domain-containing protein n=1 Tax=Exidia glandulosa HHB12029 TaxID=1314781 RepID=A0A165DUB6_EXIGL|nr:hypothetical protein EXIGLDRAFT_775665 [Exidia glandulosa HHB12029]
MPLTRLMPGARNLRFLRLTLPYRILDLGLDTIHRFTHTHVLPLPETPLNFDSLAELVVDFAENHVCSPFLFTLLRLTPRLQRLELLGHLSFETYRPHYEQQGPANHVNETWPEPVCSLRSFRCGHYLRPRAICMILRASCETIEDLALEVNTAVCRMIVETIPALPRLRHLAFGWARNSRRPDLARLLQVCSHITQLSVHITTNGNECLEIARLLNGAGIRLQVLYLYGRAITTTTWAAERLAEMIEETAALQTLRRFILSCGLATWELRGVGTSVHPPAHRSGRVEPNLT